MANQEGGHSEPVPSDTAAPSKTRGAHQAPAENQPRVEHGAVSDGWSLEDGSSASRPKYLPYDPSVPVPPGYEVKDHFRPGYVISGSIVGGLGYTLGALVALGDTRTDFERRWLLVPIFGPFIGMATQTETCERGDPTQCGKSGGTIRALAILGGMQILGASLLAYGELSPKPRLVRKSSYGWQWTPVSIGQHGYGIAALGVF